MGNGPALDHYQAHPDLAIPRFAIPTVSMPGKSRRTVPLEIGGSQIVENQGCASIGAKALSRTKISWAVPEHCFVCQRG
jgi:hypothetical protein